MRAHAAPPAGALLLAHDAAPRDAGPRCTSMLPLSLVCRRRHALPTQLPAANGPQAGRPAAHFSAASGQCTGSMQGTPTCCVAPQPLVFSTCCSSQVLCAEEWADSITEAFGANSEVHEALSLHFNEVDDLERQIAPNTLQTIRQLMASGCAFPPPEERCQRVCG